jgi:hypothetical protein
MWKEVVVVYFELLFWHLLGGTAENHKTLKIDDLEVEI